MTINSIGSTNPLLKALETNGLSASKANLVQRDLAASLPTGSTGTAATGLAASTRAAFETKISADILSGKLSTSDAAAVKKTMDNLTAGSTGAAATDQRSPAAVGGSGGAAKSGGGGGGGSAAKTELSEAVTISGSTMTTVITYTDNTTSSTTALATDDDKARYGKPGSGASASSVSAEYAPTIDKGALVDQVG